MNQYALFTNVQDFYTDLVEGLSTAQHSISMTYFAFDSGSWAERISQVLIAKVADDGTPASRRRSRHLKMKNFNCGKI